MDKARGEAAMRSRGPGPYHVGLTGHGEELERAMGSHCRVLGE